MKRISLVLLFTLLSISQAFAGLRFSSYNIRNFDYDERANIHTNKKHLIQTIESLNFDLLAVQEINRKNVFKQMIDINFQGKYETSLTDCGGAHGQKLGFVYNVEKLELLNFSEDIRTSNVNNPQQSSCNNGSRPLAIAVFNIKATGQKLVAISVHLKSGGHKKSIKKRFKQLSAIEKVISEHKMMGLHNFVIMGDFNSTEYIVKGNEFLKFQNLVSRMNAVDAAANLKCTAYWWGNKDDSTQYPSHLDHILVSASLIKGKNIQAKTQGHCQKLKCNPTLENTMGISFDEVSDHCPLVTEIE